VAITAIRHPREWGTAQDGCDAEHVLIKMDYGGKIIRNANRATPSSPSGT
jgi:hypothetical protein